MSWDTVQIGDVVKLQRGHDLTSGQRKEGIVPVIGSAGQNGFHNVAKSSGPGFTVGRSGASIGKVTFVPVDYWPHNTCLYAKDLKNNNPRFLAYQFSTLNLAQLNSGSAQPSLNRNFVHLVKIRFPKRNIQDQIASVLSAYDNLIENNRRRITLLEESARLLYREWFVHLRFPGHETAKIVDGVPDGWSMCTYGDILTFEGGFAFKSKNYFSDGKYKIVTIKNVHDNRFVPKCESRILEIPEKMKAHCKLKTGDVLMSLTGNVGRVCIVYGENYLLNQRVAKIRPTQISKEFAYWTFSERSIQKTVENLAHGAAQLNLSPVKLSTQTVVLPEKNILEKFGKIAKPTFEQIITLNIANQKLAEARDILLPRLMDGRIEL